MGSLPTPNYVLTESVTIYNNSSDITLEAGTFVRPIDPVYLPDYIKAESRFKWHDPDYYAWCYCRVGIWPIPKAKMRKV